MAKPRPVDPEIDAIIRAAHITATKITFVDMPKPILTMEEFNGGIRVIYSRGFLNLVKQTQPA